MTQFQMTRKFIVFAENTANMTRVLKFENCLMIGQPITRRQILDSSKLKEFADNNFKFDENGRNLSKRVENTVGKGEIACYEQFFLFSQCFQKACFPGASKGTIVWEWVKNSVRKGDNACYHRSLLFPQCFRASSSSVYFKLRTVW